jgi:hypothetical protein
MTDPAEPTRYAFAYPDEAGYPDGRGTRSAGGPRSAASQAVSG